MAMADVAGGFRYPKVSYRVKLSCGHYMTVWRRRGFSAVGATWFCGRCSRRVIVLGVSALE